LLAERHVTRDGRVDRDRLRPRREHEGRDRCRSRPRYL